MGITCTKTAGTGMQLSRISEQLPCTRESGTRKDPFAVAVVRSSHNNYERSIVRVFTSARITGLIALSSSHIRLGVASQNPQSVKIISVKFCKRPIKFCPSKIWPYTVSCWGSVLVC